MAGPYVRGDAARCLLSLHGQQLQRQLLYTSVHILILLRAPSRVTVGGLVGLLTVTYPLPSDTPGGRVGLCRGQRPFFRGRCAGGWGDVTHYLAGYSTIKSGIASTDERGGLPRNRSG